MRPLIFISGPYRNADLTAEEENIHQAARWIAECLEKGWAVHCPHTNTSFFDRLFPHIPLEAYLEGCFTILGRADAILLIPGWQTSQGAKAEYDFAKRLKIPIFIGKERGDAPTIEDWMVLKNGVSTQESRIPNEAM